MAVCLLLNVDLFCSTVLCFRPAALHSPSDKVVAVMGMDITLGYFHKLLAELIPPCEQTSVRYVASIEP
jgi:hypothetical protein